MILDTFNLSGCSKLKYVVNIISTMKTLRYLDLQNCKDIDIIGDKGHLESSLISMNLTNCFIL